MHTKRYRRLDWIDVAGSLGPLTPHVGPDGAVYGPGGRLVAPTESVRRRHTRLRVAEANRIARITAAKRSLDRTREPVGA